MGCEGVYLPWPGLSDGRFVHSGIVWIAWGCLRSLQPSTWINMVPAIYQVDGWKWYTYHTRKLFGLPMFGFHICSSENKLVYFLFLSFFPSAAVTGTIPSKTRASTNQKEVQDLLSIVKSSGASFWADWELCIAQHIARSCWRTLQCRMPCRKHSIEQACSGEQPMPVFTSRLLLTLIFGMLLHIS